MIPQNQTTSSNRTRTVMLGILVALSAGLSLTPATARPTQTAVQGPIPAVLRVAPDRPVGQHLSRTAERQMIQRSIVRIARANGVVPAELALAVARVESNYRANAESPVGARGVMQIMPRTAMGEFGVAADDLWDAELNITLGIRFLEQLYHQYGQRWDAALSHYNGGTLKGHPHSASPHGYTAGYVSKVLSIRNRYHTEQRVAALQGPDHRDQSPRTGSGTASGQTPRVAMMVQAPDMTALAPRDPQGRQQEQQQEQEQGQGQAPQADSRRPAGPDAAPAQTTMADVPVSHEPRARDNVADVPVTRFRGPGRARQIVQDSEDLGRRFRARLGITSRFVVNDGNSHTFRDYGYRRNNQ